MKRGFTIVEIVIVVSVIGILSGIVFMSFSAYQKRAQATQAETLARVVASAAESYYNRNNEYPDVNTLRGSSSDGTTMTAADYTNAEKLLGVATGSLAQGSFKLVPAPCLPANFVCTGISFVPNRVYYTTRDSGANGGYNFYNGQDANQCYGAFLSTGGSPNDGNSGATAFLIMYQDPRSPNKWVMIKSLRGLAQSSDAGNSNNTSSRCVLNS